MTWEALIFVVILISMTCGAGGLLGHALYTIVARDEAAPRELPAQTAQFPTDTPADIAAAAAKAVEAEWYAKHHSLPHPICSYCRHDYQYCCSGWFTCTAPVGAGMCGCDGTNAGYSKHLTRPSQYDRTLA